MSYLIDLVYLFRELAKLTFMVITSPFAIVASFLFTWTWQ
jgi:hypothetical protein